MINCNTDLCVDALHRRYIDAEPFPHVVMDQFFEQDFADQLCTEFPPFEAGNALAETGKLGKKSVNKDLNGMGGAYRELAQYLVSEDFQDLVCQITGIDELMTVLDAGGTQESLDGADLAPHLDYNFMDWRGETLHRRINVLIYLNKDWHEGWGGNFEVHSDPWQPMSNLVKRYAPHFNRVIIMETSERSWHGHDLIRLQDAQGQSRKSISAYLFSRSRPDSEIAPRRSTFYATRPLPAHFAAGYTLTHEDAEILQKAVSKRDSWIQHYQNEVLRFSRQAEKRAKQVRWLQLKIDKAPQS